MSFAQPEGGPFLASHFYYHATMSHLPYMLQAAIMGRMGIGPEAFDEGPPRNENLTPDTPATFGEGLNWDHCENGSSKPVASPGATSFMGPPTSGRAGKGAERRDASGSILVFVAEKLRAAGLKIAIVPDDDGPEDDKEGVDDGGRAKRQKTEESTLRERELAHIRGDDWQFGAVEVFRSSGQERTLVASFTAMSMDNPWLCISCLDAGTSSLVRDLLKGDYELAEFPHVRQDLELEEEVTDAIDAPGTFRLEALTGSSTEDSSKASVTTLFSLYLKDDSSRSKDKVVSKALCSYENGEMNSVGPTLELVETAKQWRRHGLGGALMRGINAFYCERFGAFGGRVLFSVCHVTNFRAGRWFMRRHRFKDLDGMGEELGKYLDADEYDYDEGDDEEDNEGDY